MDIPASTRYSRVRSRRPGFSTIGRSGRSDDLKKGRTMSELSPAAAAGVAMGDPPLPPLVGALRRRHAELRVGDGPARPFELLLPDRAAQRIGGGGEPAFRVRIVTDKGLAA